MSNPIRDVFNEWLDGGRGRTLNQLAEAAGVPQATVYRLYNLKELRRPPTEMTIKRLSKVIDEDTLREAASLPVLGTAKTGTPLQVLLAERKDAKGFTVRSLAARLGVSHSTVQQWLSGKQSTIEPALRPKLAKALGIATTDLDEAIERTQAARMNLRLPPRAANLSNAGWRALMDHMDYLLTLEQQRRA